MISRYVVITLAFGAAVYRLSQGAWVEAGGLLALGAGLIALTLSARKPAARRVAFVAFGVTALAVVIMVVRRYGG